MEKIYYCKKCNGTGEDGNGQCLNCNGTGVVDKPKACKLNEYKECRGCEKPEI